MFTTLPKTCVLQKLATPDLVFLGTRHKRPRILNFIASVVLDLHDAGVTHIGLEIDVDQQVAVDKYMAVGNGLAEIKIIPAIDCVKYRQVLSALHALPPEKRPACVALDLPDALCGQEISRKEYMAAGIKRLFEKEPAAKMLVVVGNLHTLKKLE